MALNGINRSKPVDHQIGGFFLVFLYKPKIVTQCTRAILEPMQPNPRVIFGSICGSCLNLEIKQQHAPARSVANVQRPHKSPNKCLRGLKCLQGTYLHSLEAPLDLLVPFPFAEISNWGPTWGLRSEVDRLCDPQRLKP